LAAGEQLLTGPKSLRVAVADWMNFLRARTDPPEVLRLSHWVTGGMVRMDLHAPGDAVDLPAGATTIRKPTMWCVKVDVAAKDPRLPRGEQAGAIEAAVIGALTLREWVPTRPCCERRLAVSCDQVAVRDAYPAGDRRGGANGSSPDRGQRVKSRSNRQSSSIPGPR